MVPSKKRHFHDYPCCHGYPHCPTDSTKPGTVLVQPKEQSVLGEQAFPLRSVDALCVLQSRRFTQTRAVTYRPRGQRMAPATLDGIETALERIFPSQFVKRELQQVLQVGCTSR